MQRPWFTAQPVEEDFFETAPFRLVGEFEIARPAGEVWAELTDENPLAWCRILQRITWTSPRPFGVGTTRTVRALGGLNVLRERFFRWEEGRRKSFYVVEASTPLARRFAEDYLVEPTSEGSCRFTWTIAMEPRAAVRIANPGNRLLFGTLFRDTRKHYGLL
ncbi:MAG TPA: SRPBCC family protein [Solirubrobacterales bacterium]